MANKSQGPQLIRHFQSKSTPDNPFTQNQHPTSRKWNVLWLLPLLSCSKDKLSLWKSLLKRCDSFSTHCPSDHGSDAAKHLSASPPVAAPVKPARDNTRGLHNIDLCSHNLCRQTEHPSCCVGFVQTARGRWSTCRRPRPLFSPPPLGWCSSQPGWSEGRGLGRTPVQGKPRLETQTWNLPIKVSFIPLQVPDDAASSRSWTSRLHF